MESRREPDRRRRRRLDRRVGGPRRRGTGPPSPSHHPAGLPGGWDRVDPRPSPPRLRDRSRRRDRAPADHRRRGQRARPHLVTRRCRHQLPHRPLRPARISARSRHRHRPRRRWDRPARGPPGLLARPRLRRRRRAPRHRQPRTRFPRAPRPVATRGGAPARGGRCRAGPLLPVGRARQVRLRWGQGLRAVRRLRPRGDSRRRPHRRDRARRRRAGDSHRLRPQGRDDRLHAVVDGAPRPPRRRAGGPHRDPGRVRGPASRRHPPSALRGRRARRVGVPAAG